MSSSIISSVHHIKIAIEFMDDFIRENKDTRTKKLIQQYRDKAKWILLDLLTRPSLTDDVRNAIRKEINSDVMALPAIMEKIALLKPDARAALEDVIDTLIGGAELKVETVKE